MRCWILLGGLLCAGAAGCAAELPCDAFAGQSCVNLTVRAAGALAVDQLLLDGLGVSPVVRRDLPALLPVSLAVVLGTFEGAFDFGVHGLLRAQLVGSGRVHGLVGRGQHIAAEAQLTESLTTDGAPVVLDLLGLTPDLASGADLASSDLAGAPPLLDGGVAPLDLAGACQPACDPDESCVAGFCTPRLRLPMSTATVTSHTPDLFWTHPAGDVTVEICRDRACTDKVRSFDATGGSARPGAALDPGFYFWHARYKGGITFSPTWQFAVGPRSATPDTSAGLAFDPNGDWAPDAIVGASTDSGGKAFLFLSSKVGGLAASASQTLSGANGFGAAVANAGDINGDGFVDALICQNAGLGCRLHLGGASGLSAAAVSSLPPPPPGAPDFGAAAAGLGDVNADGYGDVAVVSCLGSACQTQVFIYHGGPTGLPSMPSKTLAPPVGVQDFGVHIASAGDFDASGHGDLLVGSSSGQAFVYFGSFLGLPSNPSLTITDSITSSVSGAGDFDGDGFSDVAAAASNGNVFIFLGNGGTAPTKLTFVLPNSEFSDQVALAGDYDGDGFSDVLASETTKRHVYVLFGHDAGTAARAPLALDGPAGDTGFSVAMVGIGSPTADPVAPLSHVLVGAPKLGQTLEFAFGATPNGLVRSGAAGTNFGSSIGGL